MSGLPETASPELRVYLQIQDLQPQFAALLGTPTRARGYPPYAGQHALIVEGQLQWGQAVMLRRSRDRVNHGQRGH